MMNWFQLIGAIVLCQAAGILGAFFTVKAIPAWYAKLKKPSFNPPNWIFGPVWTVLYTLMGVVLYRLWQLEPGTDGRFLALFLFFLQLALNALWTPIFFGLRALWPALIEVLLMLAAIIVVTLQLTRVDMVSAWLMAPYIVWVSFATRLNYAYAKLNS
jgi:tryptophan-rich sensory protein